MAEKEMQYGGESEEQGQDADSQQADGDHGGGHEMGQEDRLSMLQMHHEQTLWIYWTIPLFGIWFLLAPFTFGYLNEDLWVDPSGGRGPWFAEKASPFFTCGAVFAGFETSHSVSH